MLLYVFIGLQRYTLKLYWSYALWELKDFLMDQPPTMTIIFASTELNRRCSFCMDEYYSPRFYVDVINYPCHNPESGLAIC